MSFYRKKGEVLPDLEPKKPTMWYRFKNWFSEHWLDSLKALLIICGVAGIIALLVYGFKHKSRTEEIRLIQGQKMCDPHHLVEKRQGSVGSDCVLVVICVGPDLGETKKLDFCEE